MPVFPTNILTNVQTYQRSSLAFLQNLCCFVHTSNTKFKDFNKLTANLGANVTFDLPPRYITASGLKAVWQESEQRLQQLSCSQSANTSFTATAQELIFNLDKGNGEEDYMRVFGKAATIELANKIEKDVALNAVSGVMNQLTGLPNIDSGPYRFFGDGATALNSYQQLAQAIMFFKNYGSVQEGIKFYLPDTVIPSIVGSGLNQFAPRRNDDIAMSWEVGNFGTPPVNYYQSNLLPLHVSGNSGVNGDLFTVVSVNDPTGQQVTQITVTTNGTATDANAVFAGDLFQFKDGVFGQPNMRYLTFVGHTTSANPVQFRAIQDSASSGGSITLSITPTLNWAGGADQNLNNPITAGMQILTFPSHRAGLIVGGDAFFIALPQLPEQRPYDTANEVDQETGVSLRLTYGSLFGQNQTGMIYDAVWGSTIVPEYSMRVLVPLSQG